MINIFTSIPGKKEHSLYRKLEHITKDIDYNINILGVDENCTLLNYPNGSFSKKFFYYTEGVVNFPKQNLPILDNINFCGFISHLKDSCSDLWMKYKKPVYHLNLSANDRCENINRVKNKIMEDRFKEQINFVSTSTFQDYTDDNFYNRGGPVIDKIMLNLLTCGYNVKLTHRGANRFSFHHQYPDRLLVLSEYISDYDMDELLFQNCFYFLPSLQVHAASITKAMSFGLIPIVSNGAGLDEYCKKFNSINCFSYSKEIELHKQIPNHIIENINECYDNFEESFFIRFDELYKDRNILATMRLNSLNYYMTNLQEKLHRISIKTILDNAI